MALGVGRVVPELDQTATRWPYVVAGVGFALWGIMAIGYGTVRRTSVEEAPGDGAVPEPPQWALRVLTGAGMTLGILTAMLILLD